ncbi:MAG: glutathione S-transferase family protein [Litoreibacter sp.]
MTDPKILRRAKMLIYSVDHSLYCAKLRILLRHKGIQFSEAPPPGGGGSAEYLSYVPSGNIPALVDGELTLTDSEAIAEYIEEKHPTPAMLPNTLIERAQSRERSRFADTRLEPALRLTFPHVAPTTRDHDAVARAHTQMNKQLRALAQLLSRVSLPRDILWMGDCGTIVTLEWMALMEDTVYPALTWPDTVKAYRADMRLHQAVDDELNSYRPHMDHYLREKGVI